MFWRVWRVVGSSIIVLCKFAAESIGERIWKIGQHLAKIPTREWRVQFFGLRGLLNNQLMHSTCWLHLPICYTVLLICAIAHIYRLIASTADAVGVILLPVIDKESCHNIYHSLQQSCMGKTQTIRHPKMKLISFAILVRHQPQKINVIYSNT